MNPSSQTTPRYESTSQPGLFFWAEPACERPTFFEVVAQAEGGPVHEAWDDWFVKSADARAVAEKLAKGEL